MTLFILLFIDEVHTLPLFIYLFIVTLMGMTPLTFNNNNIYYNTEKKSINRYKFFLINMQLALAAKYICGASIATLD